MNYISAGKLKQAIAALELLRDEAGAPQGSTVTMPAEIAEAYEEVARAAEYQVRHHFDETVEMLGNAVEKLRKAGVTKP